MRYVSRPAGTGLCPGSDPAALLITTAVVVGLVVSGIVLASWRGLATGESALAQRPAGGLPPRTSPRDPTQAAGLKLLSQAARACQSVSYQGVETGWWAPGGGDMSVVDVWHSHGGQALTQIPATVGWSSQPHRSGPLADASAPNLDEAGVLGMSTRLVSLLGTNYALAVAGRGRVADRPARIVAIRRRDGSLAAWFWLDSATNLPLRREMFDTHARLISNVAFGEVRIGAHAMTAAPGPGARAWRDSLAPAQLAGLRARGWPLPGPLPANLTLLGAREARTPSGTVIDLDYSDGLSVVSIFVQRGYLPDRLTGWSPVAMRGHRIYADDPDDLSYAWSAQGYVYTLIAAAPRDTVSQVVGALPHDDKPGLLTRMKHGLHRLLSWVSP